MFNDFVPQVSLGFTAFTATNLDDIVILLLFFSQVNNLFKRQHIVMGQYLGFGALVLMSLPGFFGGALFPRPWIGLLGLVPISIGLSRLFSSNDQEDQEDQKDQASGNDRPPTNNPLANFLSPQIYSVAAITFANGSDNIGIYMPLFASCSWQRLGIILAVFFVLVAVWCYVADRLTRVPVVAETLTRYGNQVVPIVLISLGILILIDSHTLEHRGLTALTLTLSALIVGMLLKNSGRMLAKEPSEV